MADDVNGWDHVNREAAAKDVQALVEKADLTHTPASPSQPEPPKVQEPVVIAGFTRIANDDDFVAFIEAEGPFPHCERFRVPNHYPFWARPSIDTYENSTVIVLSKEDVQSLMNCTQQAVSLYGHWAVERRAWSLAESGDADADV